MLVANGDEHAIVPRSKFFRRQESWRCRLSPLSASCTNRFPASAAGSSEVQPIAFRCRSFS